MKIALINPPTAIGHVSFLSKQYPLNIMMLASYLRFYKIDVAIWDFSVEFFSKEGLLTRIKHWRPDIVGLTAHTSTINAASQLAGLIKRYDNSILTIIGGVHASALPVRTLEEFPFFDLLVCGEGERTLLEVIEAIKSKADFSNINGLCCKKDGKIILNRPRDLIRDIDEIPFPARDLISRHLYEGSAFRGFLSKKGEVDFILTSRGCVGKCTFCAVNVVYGGRLRFRSAKNVLDEIRECKNKYGVKHIVIMDDTFTALNDRLIDICSGIKSMGLSWNCFGRVDLIDEGRLKIMAESGCKGIQFGVESGSQRILDLIKKGITIEQIKDAFKWAHKYGIVTDATVLLGADPSETPEDIKMTEKILKEIKPRMFSCAVLIPFPGTEINKTMKDKGYIKQEEWDNYVFIGKTLPDYRTDYFTYEELRTIQNKLLMRFYLRPLFIIKKMANVCSFREMKYWGKIGVDFIKEIILSPRGKRDYSNKEIEVVIRACISCGSDSVREYEYKEGTICICKNCKLQWSEYDRHFKKSKNPILLQEAVRGQIHKHYMNINSIPSTAEYPPYKSFFEFLKTEVRGDCLRILDIGCGSGAFLQECLRRGHDAAGIDANDSLRAVVPADIRDRIIFSPVEKIDTFEQPFDVITFWDSFEHLANSFELLDRLKTYLKKDGVIYLRVNNNYDITNLLTLFMLRLFPPLGKKMLKVCFGFPDHVWNFSKNGMVNLLTKNGWKVLSERFSETPASRFTKNRILIIAIQFAYLCNRMIGGGKIGEYYISYERKECP